MKTHYRLVWTYKNGGEHHTLAGTLEMAKNKAKSKIDNKEIGWVAIEKIELVTVLKDEWD